MATVTSKGQITLPKTVRDALDLVPGSEVDFVFEGTAIVLRRRVPVERFEKWRGHLRGRLPTGEAAGLRRRRGVKTAVDSNVLFDLFHGEEASLAARDALAAAATAGGLTICPVVYAEVAVAYPQRSELDEILLDLGIHLDGFSPEALWEGSRAWLGYIRARTPEVACGRCGADFLIGAHALASADQLMTRDAGYFRTYFPSLPLVIPA